VAGIPDYREDPVLARTSGTASVALSRPQHRLRAESAGKTWFLCSRHELMR